MSRNERLRSAMVAAGHTTTSVSEHVLVDPKTVERWISQARTPHRQHREALARLLDVDDVFLWPDSATDAQTRSTSQAEVVAVHPNRGAVDAATWTSLIAGSTGYVDLLAFAATFLHDSVPGFGELLAERAAAGVRVRLLFGDPHSPATALRGAEEGIGEDLLVARCQLTWSYLQPLLGLPNVDARMHGCTLYNSLFRFDSTLLVNTHIYGAPAGANPVLHLRKLPGGRLFDHHMLGFERTWNASTAVPTRRG